MKILIFFRTSILPGILIRHMAWPEFMDVKYDFLSEKS